MLAGERAMHIISKKRLVSAGERYAKILPALMR
jgi:hypothetical protein